MVGVTVVNGREGIFSIEADGNHRVLTNVSFCCFLISSRYEISTVSTSCSSFDFIVISLLTLTFPLTLTAYQFVAHTLAAQNLALDAAVIAGL